MNNWFKQHFTSPFITSIGRRIAQKRFSGGPVFIGGCARSGTSLLLSMLSAHQRIFAIPYETDAFTEWKMKGGRMQPVRLDRLFRAMITQKIPETAIRWCEKRPANVRFIPEILNYFGPDARFIHLVRDPRAVCLSIHPERPDQYWVEPDRYATDVAYGLAFYDHPQVFTLKYEDLISNTSESLRQLCNFLGEEYTYEMQNWHDHALIRDNRAWFGSLVPIHDRSLHRWQKPENGERLEEIMSKPEILRLMARFSYFD